MFFAGSREPTTRVDCISAFAFRLGHQCETFAVWMTAMHFYPIIEVRVNQSLTLYVIYK